VKISPLLPLIYCGVLQPGTQVFYEGFFDWGPNFPPTDIVLFHFRLPENEPLGTVAGRFSTEDPNVIDTFTYSLVAGAGDTDNASFIIVGSQLQTNAIFDREKKYYYSIRVRTTDSGGELLEEAFTITIANINEAPIELTLSSNSVNPNIPLGTFVGNFSTTDPEDAGGTFTYNLVPGDGSTDNACFTISGSSLLTACSVNYEIEKSYAIRVRSTDPLGLWIEKIFAINVNPKTGSFYVIPSKLGGAAVIYTE
jgi:hypothetical protein